MKRQTPLFCGLAIWPTVCCGLVLLVLASCVERSETSQGVQLVLKLGNVIPFSVVGVETRNGLKDGKRIAIQLGEQPIALYPFGVPLEWRESREPPRAVMLLTDRRVYRPGKVVHLRGIARDWTDQGLSIPTGITGNLRLLDPTDDRILETNVVLSAFGSLAQSLPLPEGIRGRYQIELELAEVTYSESIEVADYQTLRVQGAGRAAAYRSELAISNVLTKEFKTCSLQKVGSRWELAAHQPPSGELVPGEPGQYLLEARAQDSGGRDIVTALGFYVSGSLDPITLP